MNTSKKLACPSCRGSRMVLGNPDSGAGTFIPAGKVMLLGFLKYQIACLDCGYVGTCLSEDERCKLEEKVRNA